MAATIYSKIQNPDLNINCFNKSSNEVSTLSFVIFFSLSWAVLSIILWHDYFILAIATKKGDKEAAICQRPIAQSSSSYQKPLNFSAQKKGHLIIELCLHTLAESQLSPSKIFQEKWSWSYKSIFFNFISEKCATSGIWWTDAQISITTMVTQTGGIKLTSYVLSQNL